MGKSVVVKTNCGRLRGSVRRSIENYDYCAFKGVPYAKPPVGELRFQDPIPAEPWKSTRDATKFGSPCAQLDPSAREYIGCEDCLYLNIYVKTIKPKTHFPVMMFIHGGAFTFGCGDDMFYGPDYLLKKDVILVTINYRLGVFGFLNLEDEVAPGNQGLKDIIMALKWIQTNIQSFGGDPNNVTIFGESAGGAAVNYLGLSPLARGLFHKAISQSGTALNSWATPPNPKQYAYTLCRVLGKEITDSKEIVEFLRSIDSITLAKMQEKMRTKEERLQLLYPFGPGVDSKSINPFLSIPAVKAAETYGMEVPYLVGYNSQEGIYYLLTLQRSNYKDLHENFAKYIHPHSIEFLKKHNLTTNDLRRLYNCEEVTKENYSEKFVDLLGDLYLVEGIQRMAKLQVLKNRTPVYLYKFTYDQGISFPKLLINESISGASHFDELSYLFSMKMYDVLGLEPLQKGTAAYKIMEQMTEMWTNFAKVGNPTPTATELLPLKWRPVTNPIILNYLDIGIDLNMNGLFNIENRLSNNQNVKCKL